MGENDFTIKVGDETFVMNRFSLAANSDYFLTMFENPHWRENQRDYVELHDIEPSIFQQASVSL